MAKSYGKEVADDVSGERRIPTDTTGNAEFLSVK